MVLLLFLDYWLIDLDLLIPAVTAKTFKSTGEITMPIETLTKEAKVVIETHPVTLKAKVSKCPIYFKAFCASYSLNHLGLSLQLNHFGLFLQ